MRIADCGLKRDDSSRFACPHCSGEIVALYGGIMQILRATFRRVPLLSRFGSAVLLTRSRKQAVGWETAGLLSRGGPRSKGNTADPQSRLSSATPPRMIMDDTDRVTQIGTNVARQCRRNKGHRKPTIVIGQWHAAVIQRMPLRCCTSFGEYLV